MTAMLTAAALAAVGFAYYQVTQAATDLSYLALTLLAAVIAGRKVKLPGAGAQVSAAEPLFFITLLKFGGTAALTTGALIAVVSSAEFQKRRGSLLPAITHFSVNSFARGVISAAAGAVFYYLPQTLLPGAGLSPHSPGAQVLALVVASLARYLPQVTLSEVWPALRQQDFGKFIKKSELLTGFAAYFLTATTARFVLLTVERAEIYSALLSLVILAVFYLAYRHYEEKVAATERNAAEAQRHAEEIAALHLRTIEALAGAIAAKDRTGHQHARRVLIYAEGLARLLGLSEPETKALRAAALLHDIGKLAIPDYILNKPGQLSPAEMEKVKTHPVVGASILERVGFPYPLVPIVRHHHEHWDGSGYPDQLSGTAIPLTARVLAVVDAFDAALHQRPSQNLKTRERAVRLLLSESGRKYDPEVVRHFITHLPTLEERVAQLAPGDTFDFASVDSLALPSPQEAVPSSLPPDTRHFDAIRSAHQEAAEMLGLAQALSSTLNLEETVSIVMARLSRLLTFDACAVYLADDGDGTATVSGAIGSFAERLRDHRAVSGQGVVGRALATGQLSCGTPSQPVAEDSGQFQVSFGFTTAYPLVKSEKVVGVLALFRLESEPYDTEQMRMLAMIAPLAADAIHNALAYRRTEARSLTDALTGLPNSRVLHSAFEQERNRAERYGNRLAILMIDLDGFKQINDTFGHQAGDDVLRAVAGRLKHELRGGDTLLRYAGDEFVALLYDAEESGLDELLRRIQDSLAARPHIIEGRDVRVSASIGYAIYGKDGRELEELMREADVAMYRNKTERKRRRRMMDGMPFPTGGVDLSGEMPLTT
jgi:diguanylate cyclase (GGDEF)-like protein/putative nucleotidyltransferase with HDIG domain